MISPESFKLVNFHLLLSSGDPFEGPVNQAGIGLYRGGLLPERERMGNGAI